MCYLLLYDVVNGFVERRAPFRDVHLALVREAHDRGELAMAGAFGDPADGAALLFTTSDGTVAVQFAESDPYVMEGLVTNWRVRRWNLVVGPLQSPPSQVRDPHSQP